MKLLLKECRKLRNVMFMECREKHGLNPMEANLNPDHHVTLTISIREIREFCFACRDAANTSRPVAGEVGTCH